MKLKNWAYAVVCGVFTIGLLLLGYDCESMNIFLITKFIGLLLMAPSGYIMSKY